MWAAIPVTGRYPVCREGPCFYPAGYLWFYDPAYYLHIALEEAEYVMKMFFYLIHTISITLVSKISYDYLMG